MWYHESNWVWLYTSSSLTYLILSLWPSLWYLKRIGYKSSLNISHIYMLNYSYTWYFPLNIYCSDTLIVFHFFFLLLVPLLWYCMICPHILMLMHSDKYFFTIFLSVIENIILYILQVMPILCHWVYYYAYIYICVSVYFPFNLFCFT